MNIIWKPNPLATIIELDEVDKKTLWFKLKIERLEECISEAHFTLNPRDREWYNEQIKPRTLEEAVDSALKCLDTGFFIDNEEHNGKTLSTWVDDISQKYIDELSGSHIGDCTCCPSSCFKCRAEEMLEINTIKGLYKQEAHYIANAFDDNKTIEEALDYLKNYQITAKAEWEKSWIPTWMKQARQAYDWLYKYKQEHFV